MKSLNDNPHISKSPEILTPEIIKWLEKEGFESQKNNDSYCYTDANLDEWEDSCYKKTIYCNYDISIYIFSKGIGVDLDYDCGGNSSNYFWKFSDYSFEEAYDEMVDYINNYR